MGADVVARPIVVLPALAARFPDNPEWDRALLSDGLRTGDSRFWRIQLLELVGRLYHGPQATQT